VIAASTICPRGVIQANYTLKIVRARRLETVFLGLILTRAKRTGRSEGVHLKKYDDDDDNHICVTTLLDVPEARNGMQ
jgi:hypothetical protein